MDNTLKDLARKAVEIAKKSGAQHAGAHASRSREVSLEWRNGRVETVQESVSRGLTVRLYVDGRFSLNSTSDLRVEALEKFIANAAEMTRQLEPDPFRTLPDPKLYEGRSDADLQILDPQASAVTPDDRRRRAKELEDAARSIAGADKIISVTTGVSDTEAQSVLVNSNGFEGERAATAFSCWAEATVKDEGDKRPEDWASGGSRLIADMPASAAIGREACSRALSMLGARKAPSMRTTVVVENRCAARLAGAILGGPLSGASLQQKRSFLEGKTGTQVGSALITVADEPLLRKGFGSRHFDGEGISARRLPLFEGGVLRSYFIDTYYGKKLGMPPTTGGMSNFDWALGKRDKDAIVKDLKEGVVVNDTTGDYSFGIRGFLVKNGAIVQPVAEMNMTGNHLELWKKLVEVGSDPYPYSSSRCPSLVFADVQLSGV